MNLTASAVPAPSVTCRAELVQQAFDGMENSPVCMAMLDLQGKLVYANRQAAIRLGRSSGDLFGFDFFSIFEKPAEAQELFQLALSQGKAEPRVFDIHHGSDKKLALEFLFNAYHDQNEQVAGAFATARDVSLLKSSQEELEATNREVLLLEKMGSLLHSCQTTAESLPIITATMERLFAGSSGRVYLMKAVTNQLTEAGVWGQFVQDNMGMAPLDCWALRRGHLHDVGFENSINPPCHYLGNLSSPYICIPLQAQGKALGVIHLLLAGLETGAKLRERTRQLASSVADSVSLALANLRLREGLQILSIRDPLTGLYNRRMMDEALVREISRAKRGKHRLAVAMMDLDHFKIFNDTYGHDAGDAVLKEVARLLLAFREGSDIACRFGGEEFVLLLPELGKDAATKLLEDFRQDVGKLKPHHNGHTLPPISVSIGLAIYPEHGHDSTELMKQADNALYRAKEQGRNQIVVAS